MKRYFFITAMVLAALFVWVLSPVQLRGTDDAESVKDEAAFNYRPLQSALLRVIPAGCITTMAVNGEPVAPFTSTGLQPRLCHVFTMDISAYAHSGENHITLKGENSDGVFTAGLRSLHSTAAMSLIAVIVLAGMGRLATTEWTHALCRFLTVESIKERRRPIAFLLVFLPVNAWVYLRFLDHLSSDFLVWGGPWYGHIQRYGLAQAYHYRFSDYSPAFGYLLGIFDLFFPTCPPVYAVKTIMFFGACLLAMYAYKIVALGEIKPGTLRPAVAMVLVLLAPTLIVNVSITAQRDVWYTLWLFAALHALLCKRSRLTLIYFGLAFAFKLQALFWFPFLLVCVVRRWVAWRQLWIVPAIYLVFCIPAWLEGRTLADLLTIYPQQLLTYRTIGNAANPYVYLRDYDFHYLVDYTWATGVGLALGIAIIIAAVYVVCKRWQDDLTVVSATLLSLFFVALVPFVLPKMQDRFFFTGDMFAILLACIRPRWFMLAVLFQCASLMSYNMWNVPNDWYPWPYALRVKIAPVFTIAALGMLCTLVNRMMRKAS